MSTLSKRSSRRRPNPDAPANNRSLVLPRMSNDPATRKGLAAAPAPTPVQGQVRLDISNALPADIMALTVKIRDGMTDNLYYEQLANFLAALTASYNGQRTLADQIASLEAQLKAARIAQTAETVNARDILKSTARACESVDNTDEALASVGWDLRRSRTPAQILPPPSKLVLRATGFPGEMSARWGRVNNFRFYELQMAVPDDSFLNPDWNLVPIRSTTAASDLLPKATIGKQMHVRVRTVGSRGPSPWSDAVTAIVL